MFNNCGEFATKTPADEEIMSVLELSKKEIYPMIFGEGGGDSCCARPGSESQKHSASEPNDDMDYEEEEEEEKHDLISKHLASEDDRFEEEGKDNCAFPDQSSNQLILSVLSSLEQISDPTPTSRSSHGRSLRKFRKFAVLRRKADQELMESVERRIPQITIGDGNSYEDDGYHTPTSEEHRVPPTLVCPPAPKRKSFKADQWRSLANIKKIRRELFPKLPRFEVDEDEIKSFFECRRSHISTSTRDRFIDPMKSYTVGRSIELFKFC